MEVIPVINCQVGDLECVSRKLGAYEKFSEWVHLDVADGRFTFNKSWNEPEVWAKLKSKARLEVHLMVLEPEKLADDWFRAGAERLIVHKETVEAQALARIRAVAAERGARLMIAINPETPVEMLEPDMKEFSEFQLLAVSPGPAGQKFLPIVLEKIKFLRARAPDGRIEIDGGVTPETAKLAKDAGATVVVSGSYLWEKGDPKGAFEDLQRI